MLERALPYVSGSQRWACTLPVGPGKSLVRHEDLKHYKPVFWEKTK